MNPCCIRGVTLWRFAHQYLRINHGNGSKAIDCTCATQILAMTTSLTSWHGTSLLAWAPPTPSPPQKVSHGNGYGPPATASRLQITCATELRVETHIWSSQTSPGIEWITSTNTSRVREMHTLGMQFWLPSYQESVTYFLFQWISDLTFTVTFTFQDGILGERSFKT